MSKEYFSRPKSDYYEADPVESLARTVYETDEVIDIGLVDSAGNPIVAREKKRPIGYIIHKI
jgi:hypothetical protein